MTRRLRSTTVLGVALAAAAAILVAVPAAAATSAGQSASAANARSSDTFPTEFALPTGFLPEGIAIGSAPYAFFGSRADGDIFRVNLVTGEGSVISQGPGTPSVGLKIDNRSRLFVAGGPAGNGRVVDADTGEILASYTFATAPTFVNDVVLTPDAAWFTDSMQPFLYKVPLGAGGSLADQSDVVRLPLGGDYVHQPGFNLNGIARTPDGDALLVVQSSTGLLFRVDPSTGDATTVDLGGTLLPNGDGLLLDGRTLFVVQNQLNRVAVVELNNDGTEGAVTGFLTDPRFDIPTTVAEFANRLYLPNARFTTPQLPTTTFNAVAIPKP
jgi:sugar lactone lactonase YvrE